MLSEHVCLRALRGTAEAAAHVLHTVHTYSTCSIILEENHGSDFGEFIFQNLAQARESPPWEMIT